MPLALRFEERVTMVGTLPRLWMIVGAVALLGLA
jgi:hypothetical protein